MTYKTQYEDYLILAQQKRLKLLLRPDQLPESIEVPALWQCEVTGEIFDRTFHSVRSMEYPSHGQQFWATHGEQFDELARTLGIEFVYDPQWDYAPSSVRTPVKWRGKNGQLVVASYYQLGYGVISANLRRYLGLDEDQPVRSVTRG